MNSNRGVAVVIGASSGIGRETAIELAGKGFKVIAAARREDRLKTLAAESSQIVSYPVDLTDEAFDQLMAKKTGLQGFRVG